MCDVLLFDSRNAPLCVSFQCPLIQLNYHPLCSYQLSLLWSRSCLFCFAFRPLSRVMFVFGLAYAVHLYVHVYTSVYKHVHTYAYTSSYICEHKHMCTQMHMQMPLHLRIYSHVHVHVHSYMILKFNSTGDDPCSCNGLLTQT